MKPNLKTASRMEQQLFDELKSINHRFDEYHCIYYIDSRTYNYALDIISKLRSIKSIDGEKYHELRLMFKSWFSGSKRIKELNRKEPRLIAQKFIGRKNIRQLIFNRDGNKCLKCGSINNLQIDHIVPINKGGANKIMNLQTLCRSCNSSKSDKYFDYR